MHNIEENALAFKHYSRQIDENSFVAWPDREQLQRHAARLIAIQFNLAPATALTIAALAGVGRSR